MCILNTFASCVLSLVNGVLAANSDTVKRFGYESDSCKQVPSVYLSMS